jgi:hypothetical protein
MAQHDSIKDFFRRMPNALLARLFWLLTSLEIWLDGHLPLDRRREHREPLPGWRTSRNEGRREDRYVFL